MRGRTFALFCKRKDKEIIFLNPYGFLRVLHVSFTLLITGVAWWQYLFKALHGSSRDGHTAHPLTFSLKVSACYLCLQTISFFEDEHVRKFSDDS